jgi:hypothetical protein
LKKQKLLANGPSAILFYDHYIQQSVFSCIISGTAVNIVFGAKNQSFFNKEVGRPKTEVRRKEVIVVVVIDGDAGLWI